MSFADNVDLEAQVPYSDSPEFDKLSETLSTGLFQINSNLVTLHSHLKALERKAQNADVEERTVNLLDDTREKFKQLTDPIREVQLWPDTLPAQKFTQQKLSREFRTALSEFQDIQRVFAEKQRSMIVQSKTDIASSRLPVNGLIDDLDNTEDVIESIESRQHQQTQLQEPQMTQEEIDYQQNLIQEREVEIQEIEQGIEELNEIFTDLGTIVTEQGTIIDNIEANIYNIASATRDASHELVKAARHQRNSRGRACCLLIILSIVLAVILLGVS